MEANGTIKMEQTYKGWKPIEHHIINDEALKKEIHEQGFAIRKLLSDEQVAALRSIYQENHSFEAADGGMFYSLYSKDLDYRMNVHNSIGDVLKPVLQENFHDYKNVINTFVVKASGPKSEFYVHQDTTAMDELQYSPLSLWIPLQDITPDNGALAIIEKTHWFFSPYRGVSFNFPFSKINDTVRKYLKPIYMKAGEILLFDARIIHNSMQNISGSDRVSIVCGLFPKEADFITCYKDPNEDNAPIELYKHDDDFTLKYPNFFYNCHDRPPTGEKIGEVPADFPDMAEETFIKLCEMNGIQRQDAITTEFNNDCNMIAEPANEEMEAVLEEVTEQETVETTSSSGGGLLEWVKSKFR